MNQNVENMDVMFFQLVLSLQAGSMQQMGKVVSPVTGKVERDLVMAGTTIDILSMIETKTKGNLSDEEGKFLTHVLYELRMNYMDETEKEKKARSEPEAEKEKPEAEKEKPEAEKEKPEAEKDKPEAEKDKPEAEKDKPEASEEN